MEYSYNRNYPSEAAKTGIEFILFVVHIPQFSVPSADAIQILWLLDDPRRRQLPSPIFPSQTIEIAGCLSWCPGGMDLFDVDSMDCGHSVLECRSSVCDSIQPMLPCVLWAVKGVIR